MRFRHLILLAGLAPLLSVPALGLPTAADHPPGKRSLVQLLRSVAILVAAPESSAITAPAGDPSPRSLLALEALAHTPLSHSLWMIRPAAAASLPPRVPRLTVLRC
jgi:hypothetical protein